MPGSSKSMAAESSTTITEQWIREKLQLKHPYLGDVRSLSLPGSYEEKIGHLGTALKNFVRLKRLDLSCNALVSVEGVQHAVMLERLNLYYNCIPSIEEVKVLCKLPALKELDLRLNPLTRSDPHYRLYLIHSMSSLQKLDDCPVRDIERKAANIQFSSASLNQETNQRSSNQRLTSVENLTRKLSRRDNPDDIVLNLSSVGQKTEEGKSQNILESVKTSSLETVKSILKYNKTKFDETHCKEPQIKHTMYGKHPTSVKVSEKPRVSFGPDVEKCGMVTGKPKLKENSRQMRHQAKGHFTPNPRVDAQWCSSSLLNVQPPSPSSGLILSDSSNPILHPARMSYSSMSKAAGGSVSPRKADRQKKSSYRKPLKMLLDLVDKHWAGERSLHQNNNFLSQAVQILSMMEDELSVKEAKAETLRGESAALRHRAEVQGEEHRLEVRRLSRQLEEAHSTLGVLHEQLRIVLEENVGLQKQLIKLEQQYLKSLRKISPITQIKEAQTEVEELRKEIEVLREKVREAEKVKDLTNMQQASHRHCRSLVVTNERSLGEPKGSWERR